jgi:tetrahydromethanopterin S-methyltransferase subunit B
VEEIKMFEWTDKVDGVDDILAEDINSIAHQVKKNEEAVGEFETALDTAIALCDSYIDGGAE